jgi:cell division protein FtsN
MRASRFRTPSSFDGGEATRMRPHSGARRLQGGGTLLGIFIGLVIGLGMAASVAYYLMRNNPAFSTQPNASMSRETAKDPARIAKSDPAPEKPRFDFYKILPGSEEPKVTAERKAAERPDRMVADQAKERSAPKTLERVAEGSSQDKVASVDTTKQSRSSDRFWLQAGSFSSETEAESLRARLAFAGWEAIVQQGLTPDRATRYRVRIGPYDNQDEMQRIKTELGRRGFDAAVIKY